MRDFIEPAGGYGRIWERLYRGSLFGTGPEVFCVWPYVIANMRRAGEVATVLLNPEDLKNIFGVDAGFVVRGIEKLCQADPMSQNGKHLEGRRLVHISGHQYQVVNGPDYMAIRAKESHAAAQARYREKQKRKKGRSQGQVRAEGQARERRFVRAVEEGDERRADRIAGEGLAGGEE